MTLESRCNEVSVCSPTLHYYTGLLDSVTPFELHFAVTLAWSHSLDLQVYFGFPGLSFGNLWGVGGMFLFFFFFSIYSWLFCTTTTKCGLSHIVAGLASIVASLSCDQCLCVASSRLLEREEKKWKSFSCVQLFATPWSIQSMEFSSLEYWSG